MAYKSLKPRDAGGQTVQMRGGEFTEAGADTLTVDIDIPAGAIVTKVEVYPIAQWAAATSATLTAGDASDADGFIVATNMKTATVGTVIQGGKAAEAYDVPKHYAAAAVITFKIVSVGAGAAGSAKAYVEYIDADWTAAA